jgi:excisionase family DNA binding protein
MKGELALCKYAVQIQPEPAMDRNQPELKSASSEKLLTASELEAWLDIDVNTVYGYVQRGLIPYIKIQSNVRFRRTEIEDWLETHSYRPRRGINGAKRPVQ